MVMTTTTRSAVVHPPRVRAMVGVAAADPARTARLALAAIAVLGVGGVLQRALPPFPLSHVLDLDFEWVPAALFSSGLLAAAALVWWQLPQTRAARYVTGLLALMSLDELCSIHETLENVTGVDWELLYAPVVAVAGLAALVVLRSWGRSRPSALLLGGGLCWLVAQVLEALEWDGDVERPHYALYMVPEELLEMTGSTLLLLAGLWAFRSLAKA